MKTWNRRKGFTLIEVLAVVAIIILIMSMALPGLSAMMKAKKWNAAMANIQKMVSRARALATGARTDYSVEFNIADNGTMMWLESEVNDIERIPDLMELQRDLGGSAPIRYFLNTFYNSGGRYKSGLTEVRCTECGHEWTYTSGNGSYKPCPNCGRDGWTYQPEVHSYYYDITYDPTLAFDGALADNARQSDKEELAASTVTIDEDRSINFFNWDSEDSVSCYGYDDTKDIRVGVNGALMQTVEPVIALRYGAREKEYEWRGIRVIRCTGRVIDADLIEKSTK